MAEIKRISVDELTGLRGIAAFFVMINHVILLFPKIREMFLFDPFACVGIMGMDLFFVLSGFVIHYNYSHRIKDNPKEGILKFLIARFSRLYPLYFIFIIGMFIYNLHLTCHVPKVLARDITTLPIFLSGMQSWLYSFVGDFPVIYCQQNANISWSISTEFALYLFFIPLVFLLFKVKKTRHCFYIFFALIILNLLWVHLGHKEGGVISNLLIFSSNTTTQNYTPCTWLIYHSPLARIFEFLAGCMVSKIFINKNSIQDSKFFKYFAVLIALAMCFYTVAASYISLEYRHLISRALIPLLILSITLCGSKILKSKLFIFLGETSYSAYLLHIIFVQIFQYNGIHAISYVLNLFGFIIFTYLSAYLTYRYYEMPARKKIREFFSNKT